MKLEKMLEALGYTELEARVLLFLFSRKKATVKDIIKYFNLNRATTYSVIQRLVLKGVVSYITYERVRYFSAIDPRLFLSQLEKRHKVFRKSFLQFLADTNVETSEPEARVFVGKQAVKLVFLEMLEELKKTKEAYYDFGVSGLFYEVMGTFWFNWQKKKEKYKIKSYCIFNESLRENEDFLKNYCGYYRFYPREFITFTDTIIYGSKVVIIVWSSNNPIAIVIKNKELAISYLNQFNYLWKKSKK